MSKTAITIAIFFPRSCIRSDARVGAQHADSAAGTEPEWTSCVGTHGAGVFDHLSMGPDPGGKTGDTVTPTTTKTGQPSSDGTGASNQSGASSTAAPEVASEKTDPRTGPTSGSATSKQ